MYQIHQFKPVLYALLMLGMFGFSLAASSPLALVLGCGGVAINGWLVMTGRFRPMPRPVANLITIGSMLIVARQLLHLREGRYAPTDPMGNPVLIIGHFLVVLQLVKVWEQRVNRDYGQLLVLGLLQMVAASINTNQLVFGMVLVAYLLLSLYGCLLFHLKVEGDRAQARADDVRGWAAKARARAAKAASVAGAIGPGREVLRRLLARRPAAAAAAVLPAPATAVALARPAQRQLNRSLRRLVVVVAAYAVGAAVLTFLFFPRGPGNGVLAQTQVQVGQTQTGYTDTVNFEQISPLLSDQTVVGHARVTKNGRPLGNGETIYLRGATNGRYRPDGAQESRRDYTGIFVGPAKPDTRTPLPPLSPELRALVRDPDPAVDGGDTFALSLAPTSTVGSKDLFVVSGTSAGGSRVAVPRWFQSRAHLEMRVGGDGAVRSPDLPNGQFGYEMTSATRAPRLTLFEPAQLATAGRAEPVLRVVGPFHMLRPDQLVTHVDGRPVATIPEPVRAAVATEVLLGGRPLTLVDAPGGPPREVRRSGPVVPRSTIPPEVAAYARRADVSGEDEAGGPLAARRNPASLVDPVDETIAQNLERHLRTQFTYSTDITDAKTRPQLDPIVWFLSDDGRRGHCEYFAWAMALMCQSLGMDSRVALGFKCDEYNPFSQQYVVKQLHAHAWVEVLTADGWKTYDPTSGRGGEANVGDYGVWQQARHLFDWLESAYTNNVIYYSNESRENLIQTVETQMNRPLYAGVNQGWITGRLSDTKLYQMLADPGGGTVAAILGAAGMAVGGWYARRAWRRRRLRRRAERIGLDALPEGERLRLARQLGFYDDLLTLLERRQIRRQGHQTPLEFAQSLLYLPADAYETIHRLTELFYRVRYGQQSLSGGLRKRVAAVVAKLDADLGAPSPTA
jgi:transglutaminase-like putative cysteine protease